MPRFDQQGPMGEGPMTGRKMGKCTNYGAEKGGSETVEEPQYENVNRDERGFGFGRGRAGQGFGWGRGFGWRQGFGRGCFGKGFGRRRGFGQGGGRNRQGRGMGLRGF
ncbi:MAG: DUF5320 domain-containing protein [Fermentimonas sp.]